MRRALVVDGAIAVGPIHLFAPPMARDRYERVLIPRGSAAGHHVLYLRANDVPDLSPNFAGRSAERGGMTLGPDRLPVRVVVEAGALWAPPHVHRVPGGQQQAHRHAQWLWPPLWRPQAHLRPILGAHEARHFAIAL